MNPHFLFAVLIAVTGLLPLHADEPSFPLNAERMLFLGDSITNAGHFVVDIEVQLRLHNIQRVPEIINIGLPSETCTGLSEPDHPFPRPNVHERLDRALAKARPDVVVACYGMNDGIYSPFDEDRFAAYQAGIKKLVAKVHAAGAKIVLLTPPPFDPVPLRGQAGKLLPAGAEKYAWFAIYEDYDSAVIRRYAEWIMTQSNVADMVIDVHTPLTAHLAEQRRTDPEFTVSTDGVHMDASGHRIMAQAILNAWDVPSWIKPPMALEQLVSRKERLLHAAWLSHVGHKRPGVTAGLPLDEARDQAKQIQAEILAATEPQR